MFKRIFASFLDEAIVAIISAILFALVQVIMKAVGFKMVTPEAFALIIFAVVNVLYFPILEGSGYATTIGKRLLKLDD